MDKTTVAYENFKNIQELIRFMDQKAAALFVVYGFILSAFIEFSKELDFVNVLEINGFTKGVLSIITFIVGTALVCFIAYQLYIIIIHILKPRKSEHYNPQELSVMYYDHITQMGKTNLIQNFNALNNDQLTNEVLGQIYEVSKIMEKKSDNLRKTIGYLPYSIIGLLIFIFLSEIV